VSDINRKTTSDVIAALMSLRASKIHQSRSEMEVEQILLSDLKFQISLVDKKIDVIDTKVDHITDMISQLSTNIMSLTGGMVKFLENDVGPVLAKLLLVQEISGRENKIILKEMEAFGNRIEEQSDKFTSLMGTQLKAEDVKAAVQEMATSVLQSIGDVAVTFETKVSDQLKSSFSLLLSKVDNIEESVSSFQSDSETHQEQLKSILQLCQSEFSALRVSNNQILESMKALYDQGSALAGAVSKLGVEACLHDESVRTQLAVMGKEIGELFAAQESHRQMSDQDMLNKISDTFSDRMQEVHAAATN
jgi:hypothetical protein